MSVSAQSSDPTPAPRTGDALVVVDVQVDFLTGGALAVENGERVIAPLNRCIDRFVGEGLTVVATRDWHPADHCSFVAQGGTWPPHCVAGTRGAAFAAALRLPSTALIVSKGTAADREAYSGFAGTTLENALRGAGVGRLFVGGLATDYCVLDTVLDARARGFDVVVLEDAIAAVDAQRGDGERALERMRAAGAVTSRSTLLWRETARSACGAGLPGAIPPRRSTSRARMRALAGARRGDAA